MVLNVVTIETYFWRFLHKGREFSTQMVNWFRQFQTGGTVKFSNQRFEIGEIACGLGIW
jgi:hypothetical protein